MPSGKALMFPGRTTLRLTSLVAAASVAVSCFLGVF